MESVRPSREGVLIDVHVVPDSRKESIEYRDGVLKVKVNAPPEKGKANRSVLRILSEVFGSCTIVRGHLSRRKTLLIPGETPENVLETLESLAGER